MPDPLILLAFAAAVTALVLAASLSVAQWRQIRANEPYHSSFEMASVGLVHVDMSGHWIRVNEKMAEIVGYPVDELIGKRFSEVTVEEDIQQNLDLNAQLRSGEISSYAIQKRYRRKDGTIVWAKLSVTLVRDRQGEPEYFVSVVEDIDELKRAEIALAEQQARFRAFWDNSPLNLSLKDIHGRLTDVNPHYLETYDLEDVDVRGRTQSEAHGTEWSTTVDDFDREIMRTRKTQTSDIAVSAARGEEIVIRVTKFPVFNSDNEVVGVGGISYDITSQVRNARELREREERFRATFEQAAVGIAHVGIDGQWLRINQRYCDIVGYSEEELRKLNFMDITHPDDKGPDLAYRDALVAGKTDSYTREKRYIRKNGEAVWVAITASLNDAAKDEAPYLIIVVEDISDRKEAETALAARLDQQGAVMAIGQLALQEDDLEVLLNKAADMVAETLDVDICLISRIVAEPADLEIIAASRKGKNFLGRRVHPETEEHMHALSTVAANSVIFDQQDPNAQKLRSPIIDEIGTISGASVTIAESNRVYGALVAHSRTPRHFTGDDLTFLQAVANVLSTVIDRGRISGELADRERTLNAVLDNAADGIVVADENGKVVMANNAAETIFGYDTDTLRSLKLRDLIPVTYPHGATRAAHESGLQLSAREMVGLRQDGTTFPIDIAMSEYESPHGLVHIALVRDITEQKSLQSQLVQASKLATVGEMAAGIAHELNQPLNIMRMAADNVLIRMESGSADLDYAQDNLTLISEQAGRMGKIILHMRVFSRQDTSDFIAFDPTRAVRNACEMMRRQIELESIELNLTSDESNVSVEGIESQLEQVIINMITNARDAILETAGTATVREARGRIDVSTGFDESGETFCIRVHDTGGGMPEGVMAKVFDPFFTTKEVGVGTGLGLSVSYGIINSMGGTITASNVDKGCEMIIELPVSTDLSSEQPDSSENASAG